MNKKLILSSLAVLGLVSPAVAAQYAPFPSDTKLMQENMIYENAATQTNMGVYAGEVTAKAEYDPISHFLEPGSYLPMQSETTHPCPQNNYCPGGIKVEYSAIEPQGLTRCPGDYTMTDGGGAISAIECYKDCDSAMFQNAKELVSGGKDYYSSGMDTCQIASCDQGYHLSKGDTVEIGDFKYEFFDSEILMSNGGDGSWEVTYRPSNETTLEIYGQSRLSEQSGGLAQVFTDVVEDSDAENCFCNITGYRKNGENGFSRIMASKWVYLGSGYSNKECGEVCGDAMGSTGDEYTVFKISLLDSITYVSDACMPNVININWDGASEDDVLANDAGSVEYGGHIRTPVKAQTIKGKTFKGWRFEKVSQ